MSTDSPELVDLVLSDLTEQDLVDIALADAAVKLPDWTPREGHTEVVLLEAQALIAAEVLYTVNQLPNAVLESVIALYGLTVDPGAAPVAPFTMTTSTTTDTLVPAGTRIRVTYNGDESLDFLTDTDLLITAAAGTATVNATAEAVTEALNGAPTGITVELVDAILAIDTVTLAGPVTGGRVAETPEAYRSRGANLFRRLVSTLVLPEHFTAAALEFPAVARATTLDLYNPGAVPAGAPGDHPGHVTVAAAAAGGAALAAGTAADLLADLTAKAYAALEVHVIAPTITAVAVTADLVLAPGADPAAVEAAAEAALTAYLDPDVWPWAGTVYRNELIALLDRVAGVARVNTLTAPAADVVLAGVAPLADAGVLTITTS